MDKEIIDQVWEKALKIEGFNPVLIRKDCCGAWIMKSEYGNRNSKFGWEVDHVFPQAKGGDDQLDNLRPMQWENNDAKGTDYPVYRVAVQAVGNDNMNEDNQYRVQEELQERLKILYNI